MSATLDSIVIGAGLAGLHAASLLEARGLDVLVLEAQQRVGGRIHSMRQLGDNAEAGGTYIGSGYERVFGTAERHGIELVDVTPLLEFFREQDFVLDGEIIRQADWPTHAKNPFPAGDRQHLPWNYHRVLTMRDNPLAAPEEWTADKFAALDISMHDWLAGLGLDEAAIKIAYGINTSFGRDADDVSALLMLFRGAFSKAQRALMTGEVLGFTAKRGVQRIPEAMAASLRGGVELGQEVTAIADGGRDVTVSLSNGRALRARHVVCSVPFGVLRKIRIDPPLAGLQAEAVLGLPSQPITQVYLAVKQPFWNDDGYSASLFTDTLAGMVAAVRAYDDPDTVTHLSAWAMGANADKLDALGSDAAAGRAVIAAIESVRPAARGHLELIGLHSWGADPYAKGAWAYFQPGQVHRWVRDMGRAHGKIHFCGEHLAATARGMEGALEAAENAVEALLSTYAL